MYMRRVPIMLFPKARSASLNPKCLAPCISRFLSVPSSDGGLDEVRTQITKAKTDINSEESSRFIGPPLARSLTPPCWSQCAIKMYAKLWNDHGVVSAARIPTQRRDQKQVRSEKQRLSTRQAPGGAKSFRSAYPRKRSRYRRRVRRHGWRFGQKRICLAACGLNFTTCDICAEFGDLPTQLEPHLGA